MKAFVLAAGFGTRLKPLTDLTPKPLLPVAGLPMIFYALAWLKNNGVTEIVINTHHLGEQIHETLSDGSSLGLQISYANEEPKILGTGGGIKNVLPFFSGEENFLVVNGDIITDAPFAELQRAHAVAGNPLATLVLRKSADAKRYGVVEEIAGKITSLTGKPNAPIKNETHFTGVHLVNLERFEQACANLNGEFCVVRQVYVPALERGEILGACLSESAWFDCGTPEDLRNADDTLPTTRLSYAAVLNAMRPYVLNRNDS